MFEQNYSILEKMVAEKGVIIPVSQHRKPDGTFDLERNLGKRPPCSPSPP